MGAESWLYFIPFEEDISNALEQLKLREFLSGRFRGNELNPKTIEEALINMEADGTASILDMYQVSEDAKPAFLSPAKTEILMRCFDTDQPTHTMVSSVVLDEGNGDNSSFFWEDIERGEGRYVVIYDEDGKPSEYFLAGFSFD